MKIVEDLGETPAIQHLLIDGYHLFPTTSDNINTLPYHVNSDKFYNLGQLQNFILWMANQYQDIDINSNPDIWKSMNTDKLKTNLANMMSNFNMHRVFLFRENMLNLYTCVNNWQLGRLELDNERCFWMEGTQIGSKDITFFRETKVRGIPNINEDYKITYNYVDGFAFYQWNYSSSKHEKVSYRKFKMEEQRTYEFFRQVIGNKLGTCNGKYSDWTSTPTSDILTNVILSQLEFPSVEKRVDNLMGKMWKIKNYHHNGNYDCAIFFTPKEVVKAYFNLTIISLSSLFSIRKERSCRSWRHRAGPIPLLGFHWWDQRRRDSSRVLPTFECRL